MYRLRSPRTALLATLLFIAAALPLTSVARSAGLDVVETDHLTFMREEEKLARDVYLTFAQRYPNQPVFQTIATSSEQTHTDTIKAMLDKFGVADPNPATNVLPASIGVFTGASYGDYFSSKFEELTAKGARSELDALYVGAFIEELDMNDIIVCPAVILARNPSFPTPCGRDYTDERALQNAYSSLVAGSQNHLRAYVGQIEAVIGVGNYRAQYLTQAEVDAILGR